MDLPAEIRLKIWELLLVAKSHAITVHEAVHPPSTTLTGALDDLSRNFALKSLDLEHRHSQPTYPIVDLQVLLVCRLFHREGTAVLYSSNTFRLSSPRALTWFIAQIGTQNASDLRKLIVHSHNVPQSNTANYLIAVAHRDTCRAIKSATDTTTHHLTSLQTIEFVILSLRPKHDTLNAQISAFAQVERNASAMLRSVFYFKHERIFEEFGMSMSSAESETPVSVVTSTVVKFEKFAEGAIHFSD